MYFCYNTSMEKFSDRIKGMPAKQKLSYIWDYYKVPIILGVILIYAVTSFIHGRLTAKHTVFRLVMIDSNVTAFIEGSLLDGFEDHCKDFDPDHDQMILDAGYDLSDPGFGAYTTEQKLLAEYNVGSIDGTIAPEEEIKKLAESQAFADLSEALPEDFFDRIRSLGVEMIYNKYEDPATGSIHEYPCALNISKSPLITSGFTESTGTSLPYYDKDCYYAISPNGNNLENSISFLEYLLEY